MAKVVFKGRGDLNSVFGGPAFSYSWLEKLVREMLLGLQVMLVYTNVPFV